VIRIREAIVVEGRYDKNALAQVVDTVIVETAGFGIFRDGERLELLRQLARRRGLIVLTDSDGGGLVIRNHLKGAIDPALVKQAYVPEVYGRERRKRRAGKEGKLGVEGMSPQVLLEALRRAGATVLDEGESSATPRAQWTAADLCRLGLSGRPDAAARRERLLTELKLPRQMNSKALMGVLNALYTQEELEALMAAWEEPVETR
jgi:ribonuclease M5